MLENQFRRYYTLATRSIGNTGEQLLSILERRLDNVIHRLGFSAQELFAQTPAVTHPAPPPRGGLPTEE